MAVSRTRSRKKAAPISTPVTVASPPPSVAVPPPAPRILTHEQIKQRAHAIYLARGQAPGDPVSDWLEAERQLRSGL
ncbi:MAG: DUF2934 domain-containing protein [Phycisphaerales bacterium]|nr:DUF2934 domain-containing protein [Phycisphaerales bacterium]